MKLNRTSSGRSWERLLALLLAFGMFAAACGSDEEESSDTTAAAESADDAAGDAEEAPADDAEEAPADDAGEEPAAEASGEPILVMASGTIESPIFNFPSGPLGAQVAVDEVNAAGGVNGRPLELVTCNDEADPSKATACVQTAVQDGVVALIGGLSLFEPALTPLMEAESLPWVGSSSVSAAASPVVFTAHSGVVAFAGMGVAAVESGCSNAALVLSAQATPTNELHMTAGVESAGGTVVAVLQGAGPDFAPIVESALAEGAECLVSGVSPPEFPGLLSANAGRLPITTVDGSVPQALLDGLGEAADGVQVTSGFLLPGSEDANVLSLLEASQAINPEVGMDQFWFSGYVGVKLVAAALEGADEASSAAVLAGMSSISNFESGVGPVYDYSAPNPVAPFSQVFNTNFYVWELSGGQYTLSSPEPGDVQAAIELMG